METVTVNVRRAGWAGGAAWAEPDLKVDLERARKLATLLDSQFSFVGVKFGLDAIVGLVPVVGDTLTALAGLYPIWVARRHNLGKTVQVRMALNVVADWAAGSIPFVGDVVDVAFRSNLKNLKLLECAAERRGAR
jgi:hypothetical protein